MEADKVMHRVFWCFVILLTHACFLSAPSVAGGRKAFVVGIEHYQQISQLKGPLLDANTVAGLLHSLGYDVTSVLDSEANQRNLIVKWGTFVDSISSGDDVVVYYSGHGVALGGADYIVPIDAPQRGSVSNAQTLARLLNSLPEMIYSLSGKSITSLWILDACRDNPFYDPAAKDYGTLAGLGLLEGPGSIGILYAAGFGQQALDRLPGEPDATDVMSLFTRYLVSEMKSKADHPIHEISDDLKLVVSKASGVRDQRPAFYDGLYVVPWCIVACAGAPTAAAGETGAPSTGARQSGGQGWLMPSIPGPLGGGDVGQIVGGDNSVFNKFSPNLGSILTSPNGFSFDAGAGTVLAEAFPHHSNLPVDVGPNNELNGEWAFPQARLSQKQPREFHWEPNAVFLGRASAADCDVASKSFRFPFGCEVLKNLAATGGVNYHDEAVSAVEDVSVLSSAPSADQGADGIHKCVVRRIKAGETVRISSVVKVSYAPDDAAFWGLLNAPPRECPT